MKTLIVLRHAHSPFVTDGGDVERPLSDSGRDHARRIAKTITGQDKTLHPDYILCSAATRTRQTVEPLSLDLGNQCDVVYDRAVYMAGAGDLYEAVKKFDRGINTAMVVGHNPSVYQFVNFLLGSAEEDCVEKIAYSYAPGTVSIFTCDIECWGDLMPQGNHLQAVLTEAEV